jgi:hypothetical protein
MLTHYCCYTTDCFAKDRPKSCDECDKTGTSSCYKVNYYETDPQYEFIYDCVGINGYGGELCNIKA